MSGSQGIEERLLRYAAPALYQSMVEAFSTYHIHPYDVHGTISKNEHGFLLTIRYSTEFTQKLTKQISSDQAIQPNEEISRFFLEAAEECKSQLINDYYKMIKL
ncbi:hypothetical protein [Bacillus massilinigeriensis]|uniref:hypothetical protein n=1 Tax=Bacillus massilionigeriensis TaxID=1805475 RepID=UPI00096B2BB2|nr:hypothetical protein [Bacillus massilionigeriensis]